MPEMPGVSAHYHQKSLIQVKPLLQVLPQEGEACGRAWALAGRGKVAKQAFFW